VKIGCGGLLLATFVILITAVVFFSYKAVEYARKVEENRTKAAAELFVKVNPDMELVSADDQAGTMTLRIKETGKLVTVTYGDVAQRKFLVRESLSRLSLGRPIHSTSPSRTYSRLRRNESADRRSESPAGDPKRPTLFRSFPTKLVRQM
jgi:hypothetical protein